MKRNAQVVKMDSWNSKSENPKCDNRNKNFNNGKVVSIYTKNHSSAKEINNKVISYCKD